VHLCVCDVCWRGCLQRSVITSSSWHCPVWPAAMSGVAGNYTSVSAAVQGIRSQLQHVPAERTRRRGGRWVNVLFMHNKLCVFAQAQVLAMLSIVQAIPSVMSVCLRSVNFSTSIRWRASTVQPALPDQLFLSSAGCAYSQ